MKSLWSDQAAEDMISHYAKMGHGRDMALRVYSSRLLGNDPRLVLHGGGNTSVKTMVRDVMDEEIEVLCVKGSGWDMGNIEPAGLPAVRRAPLMRLRQLAALSDEDMVNVQRANLLDSNAPNPSVETLLHAFLPHKFIDHTHATAVLSLIDQPDGAERAAELFGSSMGIVPYIMPGFALAKRAVELFEQDASVKGLILLKHGIFTFAETAKDAYERMISMVDLVERTLDKTRKTHFIPASLPNKPTPLAAIAPILRGLLADRLEDGTVRRWILDFRTSPEIRRYVDGQDLARYSQQGVVTPDHTIRTKNWPLILPAADPDQLACWADMAKTAIEAFATRYAAYFERHNINGSKQQLDTIPRVVLVPGLGLFGVGASAKDAAIAADIAENSVNCITDAEAIGTFQPVSEAEMFALEYWSLEQAKLGKGKEKPLARQVVVVTGGGSGIGAATALAFAGEGAEIAVLDREKASLVAAQCGKTALGLELDVTDDQAVRVAFDKIVERFGGIDIVVSNAGAAWQGTIGLVDEAVLRSSFELNFFAHQRIAQNAVRIMQAQATGGCLLFNVSKQAVNPGKDFGPYGLPKAATLSLLKQYALDHGRDGIRANGVNADRIRSGLLSNEMITARSQARGVSPTDYMAGNLLGREVTARHVAEAFVFLARAERTTAAVLTVDGGNIEASLR